MTTLRVSFNNIKVGEKYLFVYSDDARIEGVVTEKYPDYVVLRDYSEKNDANATLSITKQFSPNSEIVISDDDIKEIFVYSNPKLPGVLNKYVNDFGGNKQRKTKKNKHCKKTRRRSRDKRRSRHKRSRH